MEICRLAGEGCSCGRGDIPEAADLLEQSVLLLGKCSNTITYERRKNVLSSILTGGSTQVSTMLKNSKEILYKNEDGMLFGKEFKDQIKECAEDCKGQEQIERRVRQFTQVQWSHHYWKFKFNFQTSPALSWGPSSKSIQNQQQQRCL